MDLLIHSASFLWPSTRLTKLTFVSHAVPSVEKCICIHKEDVTFKNTLLVQIKNDTFFFLCCGIQYFLKENKNLHSEACHWTWQRMTQIRNQVLIFFWWRWPSKVNFAARSWTFQSCFALDPNVELSFRQINLSLQSAGNTHSEKGSYPRCRETCSNAASSKISICDRGSFSFESFP